MAAKPTDDDDQEAQKAATDRRAQVDAAKTRADALQANKTDREASQGETKSRFVETPAPARNLVRVGCKLPHGLTLRLFDQTPGEDGKPVFRARPDRVTLAGRNASQVIGGYGVTDVPEDFWKEWLDQNKSFPALRSGAIFSEPTRARALDRAAEQRDVKTGTEPLDPEKPGPGLARLPEEEQRRAAGFQGA